MLTRTGATEALAVFVRCLLSIVIVTITTRCQPRPFFDQNVRSPVEQSVPGEPSSLRPAAENESAADEEAAHRKVGGVYRGTDTFVRRTLPTSGTGVLKTPSGEITLNFVETDLREVIKVILGDTLGANYVIDPQVQGSVTLQTSDPIAGTALISVLESILAVNNATLVQNDGIYRVVPSDQGIRQSGGPRTSLGSVTQSPGSQVVVVPLRHISASEVEKLLAPFAPPGGILRVDNRRNLVVIGGTRAEVRGMMDVIDTFDVDWLSGMSFGLFPVNATSAKNMVDELQKVFGDPTDSPLAGIVRFVPIERLNAVLVISSRSSYVDRAKTWIERLDVGEDETQRIYVYYAENSRAEDLATVLTQVFGGSGGEQGKPTAQLAPGVQPVRLGDQGDAAAISHGAQASVLSQPTSNTGATVGGGEGVSLNTGTGGQIRIIADKVKNAVVILAKPRDYRTVEAALRRLDIIPLQVLIEATILEVRLNDALNYGVEWFFKYGSSKISNINTGRASLVDIAGIAGQAYGGFSYLLTPTKDSVAVFVNALDSVSDVNVISSPQVFVSDNQTATITVGDQVPLTSRTSQSVDTATAPLVSSIEYRDTGVILEVTPRVNAGGLVSMDISQEVSFVNNAASSATGATTAEKQTPTISQRKVETTVAVQNGETVALGGLITDNRERTSSGVPFLSRLPVIGWLFGVKGDSAVRTELLILITPRVVGSADSARQVTQELRSRLRTLGDLESRVH